MRATTIQLLVLHKNIYWDISKWYQIVTQYIRREKE
jgi:hypothetical protein